MDVPESLAAELIRARKTVFSTQFRADEGDPIGQFIAGPTLGSGRFATVWRASEGKVGGSHLGVPGAVAIKVYRSGRSNQEYWRNEVKILNFLTEKSAMAGIVAPNIISYYGAFAVVSFDDLLEPNIHPCIVFGLGGDSVSRLLKHCRREYSAGVPVQCARKIIRDTLRGLKYIHSAGIIHTDIKPSNLLLDRAIADINSEFNVLIADFGSSTPADNLFSHHVGTDLYLAPELILERSYTSAVDIWATFVTAFELITGDPLFDVFAESEIRYGDDVDKEALDGIESQSDSDSAPQLVDARDDSIQPTGMDMSGDSSSDNPEQIALIAYRSLLLMEKVLGAPSRAFTKTARTYYNARGKLKNNPAINHITISDLLLQNYDMSHIECKALETFLLHGLKYNPDERISAADAEALQFLNSDGEK
jgi:serine/threonine protein kinase